MGVLQIRLVSFLFEFIRVPSAFGVPKRLPYFGELPM